MSYTTITPTEARPVANYKMATRMEGGRLLYIAGQVSRDADGEVLGKGDIRAQADKMPHGTRLSVSQPLDRTTPVIEAAPGAGMGAYWIRFSISGGPDLTSATMIITLTTAP